MTPRLRQLGLIAHITSSVGWLGAVAAFLILSIAGLTSRNVDTVRGAYVAMNLIGESVIVPLSLAALTTGLIQALGTEWGLFRYYWVLMKFILTVGATALLLLHQFTAVAEAAKRALGTASGTLPAVGRLSLQLVADAGLAVLLLLVVTALSVLKPWGRTPYGLRKQQGRREQVNLVSLGTVTESSIRHEPDDAMAAAGLPLRLKILLAVIGALVAGVVVFHLTGGGLGHHGH